MSVGKYGYNVLSSGRFWAYLLYYTDDQDYRNMTVIHYRIVSGYDYSRISIPNGSRISYKIYKDGVLDSQKEQYFNEIERGYIYGEVIEEEIPEEITEEVIEEEIVEDEVIEEILPDDGFERALRQMNIDGWGIEGGSIILDASDLIENDIFDGSKVNVRLEVDTDADNTSGYKATGTVSFYTKNMNWTKDPSSIYPSTYSAQMKKTLNLIISSSDSSYLHELYFQFGNSTTLYEIKRNVSGGTYQWTIPDVAGLCNNALSGALKIICKTYNGYDYYRGASEINLTLSVPDPTDPVIAESIVLGRPYSISCKRNSSNFTNRIVFSFESQTISVYEGKDDSRSWTPPYALAKEIPTLISKAGILKCTTLNGTAVVGEKMVEAMVSVPENDTTRPLFPDDGLILVPVNSLASTFSGLYIRSKTGLKATMSASSTYSTIREYSLTVGSVSVKGNPGIIDLLVDEGNVTVTAKVTDARGFSRTVTRTIYVYPYRRPKVVPYTGYNDVICERAKSSGALSPDGTYLAIKAGKSYSVISPSGTNLNPCVLRYRWKISSASQYGSWNTILANGSAELEKTLLVGNIVSSLSTSYDVEIQASDALGGEHTLTFAIMTEAISFVLYDGVDGAGFGKYPEEPHVVDIAAHMTLRVRGKFVVDGNGWATLGLASGISESVYNYGRNDAAACSYQVSNGNHVHVAFNCAFYYGGSSKVINSNAIPAEFRPVGTVYALCPMNDRYIALVSVASDGYIRVEWVQNLKDTVQTGSASVTWVDGYLDYWT